MIEHTYFVCKSSWCINITIIAEYREFDKDNSNAMKVVDGLWLKFADKAVVENEIFCDEDLPYLAKGLEKVQREIIRRSMYEDTIIIINSLQFSLCDFQEEGLTAAVIEWAAKAFGFETPKIKVDFAKNANRYVFDFSKWD